MYDRMELAKIADFAIDIGDRILTSGGEIWRVDQLLTRLFDSYDIPGVDMFILPHTILITIKPEGEEPILRHRSVGEIHPNMCQLTALNRLLWDAYDKKLEPDDLLLQLREIPHHHPHKRPVIILGMVCALLSLNYFIGGGLVGGAIVALSIAAAMGTQMYLPEFIPMNRFLLCTLAALLAGCIIMTASRIGLHDNPYLLMVITCIGLIPGIHLINACREILNGKVLSGGLLFLTAFIETFAVACGYFLAAWLFGGAL